MKKKIDTIITGILLGTIPTTIFYFLFFHNKYKILDKIKLDTVSINLDIVPIFISRCLIPSIALFFIFIYTNYYLAAKGILISVGIITFIILIIGFIF